MADPKSHARRQKIKKISLFIIMLVVFTVFQTSSETCADVITLVADEWCPYNCVPNTDTPGFMIEIAKYAFERLGHTIHYTLIPWTRAIRGTREGHYDGIVGTGRKETHDFVFPEHELGFAVHIFYVKQGAAWKYTGLGSLEQISLGVIRDYSYGNLYETYIKPNKADENRIQMVSGNTGLIRNIKKLLAGRIDALVEDRAVFQYFLYQTKTPDRFAEAGVAYEEKVYIAFSPDHPHAQRYAKILSDAIVELRTSGKLDTILGKYGLRDWVQ